jgi:hypothetical protein
MSSAGQLHCFISHFCKEVLLENASIDKAAIPADSSLTFRGYFKLLAGDIFGGL